MLVNQLYKDGVKILLKKGKNLGRKTCIGE